MLVLHVGPHKTATTYLQSNFRQQRAELLQRGWLYPAIGVRTGLAHQDIAENAAQFRRSSGAVFETVQAVARRANAEQLNVLLSAEGLRRWRPREIASLVEVFQPHPVRVVYVLRDPMAVIRSMWAQSVKGGGTTKELPGFLARHMKAPDRSPALNPLSELNVWLKAPRADFRILLYDELDRRGLDIFPTFMSEALGIDDAQPIKGVANARAPLELTEFIRLVALASGYESRKGKLDVGVAVELLFSPDERAAIVETIRTHGGPARRSIEVGGDARYFDDLEQRLRRAAEPHFRPHPDGRLFPDRRDTWRYYDTDAMMTVPEISALVERSARRLRPGAPVLAILNQGTRAIQAGRRLRNRIWRG